MTARNQYAPAQWASATSKLPDANVDTFSVEIVNRQRIVPIRRLRVARTVKYALRAESVPHAHIDVALVDDSAIRQVHRRFMGIDTSTDVLTFPLHEPGEALTAGIIVSVETAVREASNHQMVAEEEVLLYIVHGVLHLCGYDDHAASDARSMRKRQTAILRDLGCRI